MGGRTMPTECEHAISLHRWCEECSVEEDSLLWITRHPAEAVAQLVADGVLVERGCEACDTGEEIYNTHTCPRCKGSGKDGTYRLVLDEGEGT